MGYFARGFRLQPARGVRLQPEGSMRCAVSICPAVADSTPASPLTPRLGPALGCDTMAAMVTFGSINDRLRDWIANHRRVFALSGAGCSTASGIPDYRDDEGEWKRRPPVMIQAFRTQEPIYRRYWARAYAGWPRFTAAAPNAAHRALAAWEQPDARPARHAERRSPAPARREPRRHRSPRPSRRRRLPELRRPDVTLRVQETMAAANPVWRAEAVTAPDGDADIDAAVIESFAAPRCERCAGLLKPDVVFSGRTCRTSVMSGRAKRSPAQMRCSSPARR